MRMLTGKLAPHYRRERLSERQSGAALHSRLERVIKCVNVFIVMIMFAGVWCAHYGATSPESSELEFQTWLLTKNHLIKYTVCLQALKQQLEFFSTCTKGFCQKSDPAFLVGQTHLEYKMETIRWSVPMVIRLMFCFWTDYQRPLNPTENSSYSVCLVLMEVFR